MMENDFDPEMLGITFGFINDKKYTDSVPVTNYNKSMFLELLLNFYGYQKTSTIMNEFLRSLYTVIPQKLFNILEVEDLEKILVGCKKIDVEDWKKNTK